MFPNKHRSLAPGDAAHASGGIRMTTKMGGFLGRKGDGEPGTEVLWKGLQDLEKIAEFWEILERMRRAAPASSVPKRRRYG